jgi:acetolactate synthase small subunit
MAKLTLPSTVVTRHNVADQEVPDIVKVRARTRRFEQVLDELDELIDRLKVMAPGPEKEALRKRSLVLTKEMVELSTKP